MKYATIGIVGHGSLGRLMTEELMKEIQRKEPIEVIEPSEDIKLEILSSEEYKELLKPKTNYFEQKKKYRFLNKK